MEIPRAVGVSTARVPTLLTGIGLAIVSVFVCEVLVYVLFGLRDVTEPSFVVSGATTVPVALAIAFGGRRLRSSSLRPIRYPRIAGWTIVGLLGFLALNVALVITTGEDSVLVAIAWLRWASALGAGAGLGVGAAEARVIEQAIARERAELRTQHVAEQRDHLDYLNSVLRHEILNAVTAIDGYSSRVLEESEELDPDHRRWLEIVVEESEDMARVIEDVRTLLWRTTGDHELRSVDLNAVLEDEVRSLTNAWPTARVETEVEADLAVLADDTLPRVFGNLLANAVEYNDAEDPAVTVTAAREGDTVRVEVADDGPGIPDDELDALWERTPSEGGSHGLGLYLVSKLVDSYGGAVELVETGPNGTRFAVELAAAAIEDATGVEGEAVPA